MFSSLQARMMRTAISPRLATRIFSNIALSRPKLKQGLAELDRLGIFHKGLGHDPFGFSLDFVHYFHRLDNADDRLRSNFRPDFHIGSGLWRGRPVESAD